MHHQKSTLAGCCMLAISLIALGGLAQPAQAKLQYSYAVKFVCGYSPSNVGVFTDADQTVGGEATVKAGNYATEINIFNPSQENFLLKKFLLLVQEGKPVGREPQVVAPSLHDEIILPNCTATMDDCNRIAELFYGGPAGVPSPLPLFVGFLVVQSSYELDLTAVYTAETCSDSVTLGGAGMCSTPPGVNGVAAFGVDMTIDVEQIKGRKIDQ